ncbi:thioesterase [Candidatus Bathyarchaeota archaeon]|nr:thioesterase [Candidatus Bathyarchaeota archaeon]MBT7619107.1 thioesterase [Calditrichota bacterium]MBT4320641.1 thioesterase [Candidatus Bathyarchaeota archaeon]MBT4424138.1 thioesterase [Candidatus Bathyarchaeota archaeon]MBT6604087.1 thioesterase [Candidatus Bathyarchaeota archaeon]
MDIKTHQRANKSILGTPLEIVDGKSAVVELITDDTMIVDGKGLVHGGFAYGLADYAAMLAVNHPNVVLGKSESRFIAPVRTGEKMRANATVESVDGKKRGVSVQIFVSENIIYKGKFTCYVLDEHVFDRI